MSGVEIEIISNARMSLNYVPTATMPNRNRQTLSSSARRSTSGSGGSSSKTLRRRSNQFSGLHLMSATGFSDNHEMGMWDRLVRFARLPRLSEYFMSVDHHRIWRRHLAWSIREGDSLKNAVTSRFASNMVFMSLLLGTEIGVLFSPSKPADRFRTALKGEEYDNLNFWAAILLCVSIGLTLSTLVANFTAWAIIGAVSPHNSHAILRSSVGLDAAQLPARLVILSIYFFVAWIMMFIYILAPPIWGYLIVLFPAVFIAYIVVFYSSVGRLVIYSRAMQPREIFRNQEDNSMAPVRLFEELLKKAEKEKMKNSPLPLVYRTRQEITDRLTELRHRESNEMVDMGFGSSHATQYVKEILDSSDHPPNELIDELFGRSSDDDEDENEGDVEKCNGGGAAPQNPSSDKNEQGPFYAAYPPSDPSSPGWRSGVRRGVRRGNSDSKLRRTRRSRSRSPPLRATLGRGESCRSILNNNPVQQISLAL